MKDGWGAEEYPLAMVFLEAVDVKLVEIIFAEQGFSGNEGRQEALRGFKG